MRSIASSIDSVTHVVRRPQPVATTRSWWRRCRSWRLARRVPIARHLTARRSRWSRGGRPCAERRDDDARAGDLGAPAEVEVLAEHRDQRVEAAKRG